MYLYLFQVKLSTDGQHNNLEHYQALIRMGKHKNVGRTSIILALILVDSCHPFNEIQLASKGPNTCD
jgi:hypothetical protein